MTSHWLVTSVYFGECQPWRPYVKIAGVSKEKALKIEKLRDKKAFKDMEDLRARVPGIFNDQSNLVIEF